MNMQLTDSVIVSNTTVLISKHTTMRTPIICPIYSSYKSVVVK